MGKIHSLCMYIIPKIIDNTFHNSYFTYINSCSYISIKDTFINLEYFAE